MQINWLLSIWRGTLVVNGLWYQESFNWKIRLTGTTEYRAKTTATHLYIFIYLIYFTLTIGIDIGIKNDQDETVLDVLCSHPSQMSQEITALIYGNIIVGYKKDWQNGYCQLDEFIHSDFMWRHLFRFWLMKCDNVAVFTCSKSATETPRPFCKICSRFEQVSSFFSSVFVIDFEHAFVSRETSQMTGTSAPLREVGNSQWLYLHCRI